MVKVKAVKIPKGTWKPVTIEGSLLNCEGLENLIGIEELTEYSVDTPEKLPKKGKKKANLEETLESNDKKTSKKKKKRKNKNATADSTKGNIREKSPESDDSERNEDQSSSKLEEETVGSKYKKLSKKKKVKDADSSKGNIRVNSSESDNFEKNEDQTAIKLEGMEAWNGLGVPDVIVRALADKGFTNPTAIQELSLPPAIFGRRDILGAAETGSGKTLAFGIPMLHGILIKKSEQEENSKAPADDDFEDDNSGEENSDFGDTIDIEASKEKPGSSKGSYIPKPLYGLVITPTRELAVQVRSHLLAAAKYANIDIAMVFGGMSAQKQERLLNRAPEIVVATPGRLWELIQQGHPHLAQIENIRYLVIDETDRLLEKGHFAELQQLLELININKEKMRQRQNFVFSATLTLIHSAPRYVFKKKKSTKGDKNKKGTLTQEQKLKSIMDIVGLTNPKVVDVTKSSGLASSLSEARIMCSLEEKDLYLYYFLLRHPGRTLVFCNSIGCVKRLAQLFSVLNCSCWPLHASMPQKQRLKNLERFTSNSLGVLLATDVAARGLDIPGVQHVIHYQVPRTAESYVHRSGRTARAHQEGLTVILMDSSEIRNYSRIFHNLQRDPEIPTFPVEERVMPAIKQRVALARDIDKLELQARRFTSELGWLDKAAKEMDLELSDDELPSNDTKQEVAKNKKRTSLLRKQLNSLLSKPVIPKGFSGKYPTQTGRLVVPDFVRMAGSGVSEDSQSAVQALKDSVNKQKAEKRKRNNKRVKLNKKRKTVETGHSEEEDELEVSDVEERSEPADDDATSNTVDSASNNRNKNRKSGKRKRHNKKRVSNE